jgi:hypothetical protein
MKTNWMANFIVDRRRGYKVDNDRYVLAKVIIFPKHRENIGNYCQLSQYKFKGNFQV